MAVFHYTWCRLERRRENPSVSQRYDGASRFLHDGARNHSGSECRLQIKRGIYRDFPTKYKDRWGNSYVVGFQILEVLRDGKSEAFFIKDMANGKRVYIGQANIFLPPGEYTYTLTYKTERQLGFFKDHDELYWNVTGNGWVFPMDKAMATVKLPEGVPTDKIQFDGWTGPQGSREKNFTAFLDESADVHFTTTKPLEPYTGLTIVVGWPKGFVKEPSIPERFQNTLEQNRSFAIGMLGLVLLLGYYLLVWARVGKDPAKGTIIPLYTPPERLSPAAMRYIANMGYDDKTFATAILNMAVKGFLSIREEDGGYTLTRNQGDKKVLAPEEQNIATKLLDPRDKIELKTKNHKKISSAIEALKNSLNMRFDKVYFVTNRGYFFPGLLLSVIALVLAGFSESTENGGVILFMCVWLTIWSVGVVFLLLQVIARWKQVIFSRGHKLASLGSAIFMSLFAIPFVAGEGFGLYMLASATSTVVILILVAMIFINYLFYHLLKAPTRLGRKILDQIEGFKMFLSVTEKERLRLLNPPEKTPKLFERYLPYAVALDVEKAWAEQFVGVLASPQEGGTRYTPGWYHGTDWSSSDFGNFASSLGSSLSTTISSASTPPGSSSGFGGGGSSGGSSGGGGGGGGGGGW